VTRRRAAAHDVRSDALTLFALLLLTAATVGAAKLPLGPWGDVVAAVIATAKASLVVCVFMGARRAPRVVPLVVAAAVLWAVLLFGLTLVDYVTRV